MTKLPVGDDWLGTGFRKLLRRHPMISDRNGDVGVAHFGDGLVDPTLLGRRAVLTGVAAGLGLVAAVAATRARIGATPSGSGDAGMYNTSIYGPGLGFDTKANIVIYAEESMAMRFKAGTTSALNSVKFTQRTGVGYSLGNGGTCTVSIQADDGAGHPSGIKLAQGTVSPGNPGPAEQHIDVSMTVPPALTAGTIYYIVFENPSATDYFSANQAYCYAPSSVPRQPLFSDAEFGVLLTTAYNGAWPNALEGGYTPVVDITYANGVHDGNSYYEAMIDYAGLVRGTSNMVRESFKISGGNRSVSRASVRMRRASGTANLVLTLETAAGVYIDSGTIPAAIIPISQAGRGNGGSVWATAIFGASRTLTDGVAYNLRLSTGVGTTYTIHPLRSAADNYYKFQSRNFTDGIAQQTANSGVTWANMSVAPYTVEDWDLQFYLS